MGSRIHGDHTVVALVHEGLNPSQARWVIQMTLDNTENDAGESRVLYEL